MAARPSETIRGALLVVDAAAAADGLVLPNGRMLASCVRSSWQGAFGCLKSGFATIMLRAAACSARAPPGISNIVTRDGAAQCGIVLPEASLGRSSTMAIKAGGGATPTDGVEALGAHGLPKLAALP